MIVNVDSEAAFGQEVEKEAPGSLVVVHFWAEWCEPCKQMDEVLQVIAKDESLGKVKLVRVEAEKDEVEDVTEKYGVSMVPHFVFLEGGKVVDVLEGADPKGLFEKVSALAPKQDTSKPQAAELSEEEKKKELFARLRKLTRADPVVLFMKGSPAEPRCGFSKKAVAMLEKVGAKFGHFDILQDQSVRQGLKEFSNWPTYPQLYVKGELIGGFDIMQEMAEAGDLEREVVFDPEADLEAKLKGLVSSSQVILFMKGSREEPRCGFSAKVVKALDSVLCESGGAAGYETFDILKDEEVRQGLKKFSNWPTYPQLYVKGELIGGCDIILDMSESGELRELFN